LSKDQGIVQGQGTYCGPIYTSLQTTLGPRKKNVSDKREFIGAVDKEKQVVKVFWLTTEVKATT